MTMSPQDYAIEQKIQTAGPKTGLAYLLWLLLGLAGGHRFYLQRRWSAAAMLALFVVSMVFARTDRLTAAHYVLMPVIVWWFVDLALIPWLARDSRDKIRREMTAHLSMIASTAQAGARPPGSVAPQTPIVSNRSPRASSSIVD